MGKYDRAKENDLQIIARVAELADRHEISMSQISLAWLFVKGVAAPIIGSTKIKHLDDAVAAIDVHLTADELVYLEEPYQPHEVVGSLTQNPAAGTILVDRQK